MDKLFAEPVRIGPGPLGRGFRLETAQFLPQSRERVFEFFSDAFQLETLTPDWLHFSVVTPAPIHLQAGTLIDYRLKLHGIPIKWQSRITVWEPSLQFVDEQLRGPYRRWYHLHLFEDIDGGTLCRDIVDYEVPGGALMNRLFVRNELFKIFQFRQDKLRTLFSAPVSSE